jgi:hypothetical protein
MYNHLIKAMAEMRHNTLENYIVPGLRSSLVGGAGHGKVRVFEASRDTFEFITPHSHRFDFFAFVLQGTYKNTIFSRGDGEGSELYCESTIHQVCGPDGRIQDSTPARDDRPTGYVRDVRTWGRGESLFMDHRQIHSVKFSRDAIILFFEGPQKIDTSRMIEPWVDGRCVPTFKVEEWMFQREG